MFQEPQNFNSLFPPISFLVVGVYYVFKNVFFFNEKKIRISSSLRRAEVRALNLNPFSTRWVRLLPRLDPPNVFATTLLIRTGRTGEPKTQSKRRRDTSISS